VIPDACVGRRRASRGRVGVAFHPDGHVSKSAYNHYAVLKNVEDFFGPSYLGYAGQNGPKSFGKDVFSAPQ
jgi:hypothetical protein